MSPAPYCWRRLGSACIRWSAVRFSAVSAALFGGVGTHGWRQLPASVVPVLDRALWIVWSSASLGRRAAWRRPRSCMLGLCRSGRVARCWRRCKSAALAMTCRFADEALPLLQQVRRSVSSSGAREHQGMGLGWVQSAAAVSLIGIRMPAVESFSTGVEQPSGCAVRPSWGSR